MAKLSASRVAEQQPVSDVGIKGHGWRGLQAAHENALAASHNSREMLAASRNTYLQNGKSDNRNAKVLGPITAISFGVVRSFKERMLCILECLYKH